MINGIPFKIKKSTELGDDVETAYFATFRKSPELSALAKRLLMSVVKSKAIAKKSELSVNSIDKADTQEAVDKALTDIEALRTQAEALTAEIEALASQTLRAGLAGAGYDKDSVERIASEVPPERIGELIQASQLGSGALDFT
jgi:hypothetical protein